MNEEEFGFEAIRTQLERTQYLEHSVPLYLTSIVFEDAEDIVLEEKDRNIYSRYNPNTNEFVEKVRWKGQLLFCLCSGMAAVYSTMVRNFW
jgi:O-succinylhomoserine sulfhydrylase